MPRSDLQFQKALHLLDRGELARGEAILRETLAAAQGEGDCSLAASVGCSLGELLIETDRAQEAIMLLRPIAALDEYDDLLAHERLQAIGLLRRADQA